MNQAEVAQSTEIKIATSGYCFHICCCRKLNMYPTPVLLFATLGRDENKLAHSYSSKKPDLLARLQRIEGQIWGVQKMLEEERYCIDVLTQLTAIKKATHAVALSLLQAHTHRCVADAIRDRDEHAKNEKIDELLEVVRQFTK